VPNDFPFRCAAPDVNEYNKMCLHSVAQPGSDLGGHNNFYRVM
jgi:hypothetical protein